MTIPLAADWRLPLKNRCHRSFWVEWSVFEWLVKVGWWSSQEEQEVLKDEEEETMRQINASLKLVL